MPSPLVPTSPTTLQNMLAVLRRDLMDLDSSSYSWPDAVLTRCIDLALERYSQVNPRLELSQLQSIPQCRLYPVPDGAWYVDKVELPVGRWPKQFATFVERPSPLLPAPPASLSAALQPGSALSIGAHSYAVTYLSALGVSSLPETLPSPTIGVNVTACQQAVLLSQLPTGPYG